MSVLHNLPGKVDAVPSVTDEKSLRQSQTIPSPVQTAQGNHSFHCCSFIIFIIIGVDFGKGQPSCTPTPIIKKHPCFHQSLPPFFPKEFGFAPNIFHKSMPVFIIIISRITFVTFFKIAHDCFCNDKDHHCYWMSSSVSAC